MPLTTKRQLQITAMMQIFFFTTNILNRISTCVYDQSVGRDSSVGIATHYGLDGHRMESRRGRDFPYLSRPALGPTQPPVQSAPGLFTGGKVAEACRWPTTPSSTEVEERGELYLYTAYVPSWHVIGSNLDLPYTISLVTKFHTLNFNDLLGISIQPSIIYIYVFIYLFIFCTAAMLS